VEDYAEMLKARPAEEMVSGFGPGGDLKLPKIWVRYWSTEDQEEIEDEEMRRMVCEEEKEVREEFEKLM
jgi:hypothetical protein